MSRVPAPLFDEDLFFEFERATVQYLRNQLRLFVQAFDAYGYQRELSINWPLISGEAVRCHIYQHPNRRSIMVTTPAAAGRFTTTFISRCRDNPFLLFNPHDYGANRLAVNHGFVHLAERLHRGEYLSANLL